MQAIETTKSDRLILFAIVTVALNGGSTILYPAFVKDAFSWEEAAITGLPVIWGFSLLFAYRTNRERYVSWVAAALAVLWLIPTIINFGGNRI